MADGFLDRGQRLFPPPQVGQTMGLVVQRCGEVGQERRRAGPGPAGGRWPTASSIAARASSRRPRSASRLLVDEQLAIWRARYRRRISSASRWKTTAAVQQARERDRG